MVDIVKEGVADCLLRGVLIDCLFEDLAEAVPPATEALSRVDDVAGEAVKGLPQIVHRWIVVHLSVVETGFHLDQWLACLLQQCLVSGQGANDHLVDSIEDLTLPIVVVDHHLRVALRGGLEGLLLDRLQVVVTDVVIVLDEGVDLLETNFEVKIADFGLSTVLDTKASVLSLVGTPLYQTP